MPVDPNWARHFRERSAYDPRFPAFMSPDEIDRYRADASLQVQSILAELAARKAERDRRDAAAAAAAKAARFREAVLSQSAVCDALLDWLESPMPRVASEAAR